MRTKTTVQSSVIDKDSTKSHLVKYAVDSEEGIYRERFYEAYGIHHVKNSKQVYWSTDASPEIFNNLETLEFALFGSAWNSLQTIEVNANLARYKELSREVGRSRQELEANVETLEHA